MKKQESPRPLIRPYHKEGLALHAEQTVQALLDRPQDTKDIIKRSDEVVNGHFNSSITGEYKKAAWRLNIGIAAVGHLVVQDSLLDILDGRHKYGVFYRPDVGLEAGNSVYTSAHAIQDAHKNAFWLQIHTDSTFARLREPRDPYHSLYKYYENTDEHHHVWQSDWCVGPGKNRWPTFNPKREFSGEARLKRSLKTNCNVAIDLLCTKAIHHLIHKNRSADSNELYRSAMHSIEQISWQTTGNRHYGWTPDWKEQMAKTGRFPGLTPDDGVQTFLSTPPSQLTLPNGRASSVDGAALMREPNFCLHDALKDGPVAKAGLCAGNIFIRPSGSDTLDITRSFFGALGMDRRNGDCYSAASVALAMASVTLKDIVLPAYELNKEAEASRLH